MDETGEERIESTPASDSRGFARGLLENAPEAIVALDQTGTISYVNPATERILGYTPEDLTGRPGTTLIPDRFHAERSTDLRSYLGPDSKGVSAANRERTRADDRGPEAQTERTGPHESAAGTDENSPLWGGADVPLVHAAGHEEPVLVSVREGTIAGETVLVCVCRRPPDRESVERRLRERKREIEALHGVATDLGACGTPDEVYDTVIRAVERILRFDFAIVDAVVDGVLVPKAVSSNLGGEGYYEETPVDAEDNVAAEAYRTGESSVIDDLREHDAAPADSEFRSVLTVPIGDVGLFQSASKAVGAFDEHDLRAVELLAAHARARLTQLDVESRLRRRTEELERQNERLEEFASIISHDLRNPMNVAQGRLELARAACANVGDDAAEQFEAVEKAHDRMAELINDVLALAKRGAGDVDPESVSLRTVAEETWTTVETGDATLSVESDGTIDADPNRLQQLLENLYRNTVEHSSVDSQTGSGEFRVRVGIADTGFYVADDGPGIPADKRDSVFETGYTTRSDGTGFGLSIVKGIADAHGWSVTIVESDSGGARFEFVTDG